MSRPNASRLQAVLLASKQWQKELIDTSGRNRLRRYRDLKTRTLNLTPGQAYGLATPALDRLFKERPINLSDLFPDIGDDADGLNAFSDARRRLLAIHKAALTNLEEKGVETLFAAFGLATWEVSSGTPPNAPVVLLPLEVHAAGAAAHDFSIQVAGDAHLNPVLTHILRVEHDIETDTDEMFLAEEPPTNTQGFRHLLKQLEESWNVLPNLEIDPRVVVSIFSYSTMPLVNDLEQNAEIFAQNDMVAAIAGDATAREALASYICDPEPSKPDIDPPSKEFLVLDADSSQHMAINRVLGGESLVIQGPPGTGKSQTIANLIAALVAQRKRILFVAEKRAAIDAVTKRLDHVGLSNLVMDMHGGVTSRRDFARTLNESLQHVAKIPAQDYSALHRRLRSHRTFLIENNGALHESREPWNLSVFQIMDRLLGIPSAARTQLRLSTEAANALDKDSFQQLKEQIEEWLSLDGHLLSEHHPEWHHSNITSAEEARTTFDLVMDLVTRSLPTARDALFAGLDEIAIPKPDTLAEWRQLLKLLTRVQETLSNCHPMIYELDLTRLCKSLEPARKPIWTRLTAEIFSKDYREAQKSLRAALINSDTLSSQDLLTIAKDAKRQTVEWKQRAGNIKVCLPKEIDSIRKLVDELFKSLSNLARIVKTDGLDHMFHSELSTLLQRMADGRSAVANLPRIRELEAQFRDAGITEILDLAIGEISVENATYAVENAWLQRVMDNLEFEDSRISSFDSHTHNRRNKEFIKTDREHRETTPQRLHRNVAENIIKTMNRYTDETLLVRKEAAKKSRHLSVRQLLARAPHVLSSLRPCWTMSPILASEVIPADFPIFDVVIFDEASQIPPAEAIGCLARSPQAVIAGDSRQLPPTSFFGRSTDDEDDEEDDVSLTGDIESLLEVAGVILRDKMLEWHYRSRDDRLIAFSNHHIYTGALTAFPGAITKAPVTHCLVPFRPINGVVGTRSNPDEVEKVVELVLEHAKKTPEETLGVIAFGQHHANNIDNLLNRRLSEMNEADLDEFFSETNEERFFIKNIERVQGDERDSIILTVGYHKDINGNLPYRFGPILQEGGERRINVAVTRARSKIMLVSSFSYRDMDPSRSAAKGVILLRQYIEYAASGGQRIGSYVSDVPLNSFEMSIKDGLEQRGIPVTPQFGVSGYRIDFACAHPNEPGRMVLAIEADGASYHASHTTRDRDRLRQEVLESKGWRFHRIWSTAWFRDSEAELHKAEEAWKEAVKLSNEGETITYPDNNVQNSTKPFIPSVQQRGPRPRDIPRRGSHGYYNINDYSHSQLVRLAGWIKSDTLLRTDDDIVREMMTELGFTRSGVRIREALKTAIRASHN